MTVSKVTIPYPRLALAKRTVPRFTTLWERRLLYLWVSQVKG